MTRIGANRERYSREHYTTDPRPSRFSAEYRAWTERAAAWAAQR